MISLIFTLAVAPFDAPFDAVSIEPASADDSTIEPSQPIILEVSRFGAAGDGTTDDGPAIRGAIERAAEISRAAESDRPVRIIFEPRTYRIGPWPGRWCALPLVDMKNVELDGRGATLLFHPNNRCLLRLRCENITVRRLSIDFTPLPFTQADVLSVDLADRSLLVRLHDGYPMPPDSPVVALSVRRDRPMDGARYGISDHRLGACNDPKQ